MERYLSRLSLAFAMWLASASIAVVGFAFLLAGLYFAVRDISSPAVAAFSTGVAALAVAAAIPLAMRASKRRGNAARGEERAGRTRGSSVELETALGQILGSETASGIRNHPKSAAILALIAGFAVGASPELRGMLRHKVSGLWDDTSSSRETDHGKE